jgi:ketosteroid isomerase-like protein
MREASERSSELGGSDLMRRWYAAWNAHDPDAISALTTEDIVYEDPGATEPRTHGRGPLVAWARTAFRAVPDMHLELLEEWASPEGDVIATYFRFTATLTGPLVPPGIAPTNQPLDFYGMDRNEIRDDLIARHQIFWDIAERYRILGLLPQRGSRAERLALSVQRLIAWRTRRSRS